MFLEAVLAGMFIGWIRKGKLRQLANLTLSGWPMALVALILQAAIIVDFNAGWGHLQGVAPYLHIFSYIPLLLFACCNRKQQGMTLIGLGLLLNLLVIAANGGMMPVDPSRLAPALQEELLSGAGSPLHIPLAGQTKLAFLGDLIRIPYGQYKVISAGDILLALGVCVLIQKGMVIPGKEGEKG